MSKTFWETNKAIKSTQFERKEIHKETWRSLDTKVNHHKDHDCKVIKEDKIRTHKRLDADMTWPYYD